MANTKITVANMAANSIDSDQYVDGSIDTAHIADDAVTSAKLDTNIAIAGTLGSTGKITADAGIDIDNFNIDGTTIALSSGDLTLDVAGDIILDADGADIRLKDAGTEWGRLVNNNSNFLFKAPVADKDIMFNGVDGSSEITALTLDMSEAGTAIFNHDIQMSDLSFLRMGAGGDLIAYSDGTHALINANNGNLSFDVAGTIVLDADSAEVAFKDGGTHIGSIINNNSDFVFRSIVQDKDVLIRGNDGGTAITALTLDMSDAGSAIFNGNVTIDGFTNEKYLTLRSGFAPEASGGVGLRAANHAASNRDGLAIYGHDGVSILTGQTERMEINSTGQVLAQAHGVSTPSFSFIGDTNTGMTRPTGDTLQFVCGGTVRLRVSGDGLLFNSDTAAANALDDYEEGTVDWYTLTDGTATWTQNQNGYRYAAYTKIGNQVHVHGNIYNGSISGSQAAALRVPLPFVAANVTAGQNRAVGHAALYNGSSAYTGDYTILKLEAGASYGEVVSAGNGGSWGTVTFAQGDTIIIDITYTTS